MRTNKKLIVTVIVCLILGVTICITALILSGFDFGVLNTVKYETKTYETEEEFSAINIDVSTENIVFLPSEDGKCRVVSSESEKIKHDIYVDENGTLNVTLNDSRKWYERLGFAFGAGDVTIYLPDKNYNSLTINVSTGDITVTGVKSVGDVQVNVSTGRTEIKNVTCKNFITDGSTGKVVLNNVIATEKFTIKRSTGDIKFQDCDAGEISVKTSTGDVTGLLLSEKVFITDTSTGKIDVPKSKSGGICEITTSTGDIEIKIC
ncbi:MAG: DUF4097 family beta strand repeat protein [Clostridia bacterium]|nr:DUF4097 family beta strand repeat protein [Clostridia bacterium]